MENDNLIKKDEKKYSKITGYDQFKINPFINHDTYLPIKRKNIIAGSSNQIIVNQDTGEQEGDLAIRKYKEVDEEEFIKIYVSQMKDLFSLRTNAMKVLSYVMSITPINKDTIIFDMDDCKAFTGYSSTTTILDGVSDLLDSEILARSEKHYIYFINPFTFFNGNRIILINEYKRKKTNKTN